MLKGFCILTFCYANIHIVSLPSPCIPCSLVPTTPNFQQIKTNTIELFTNVFSIYANNCNRLNAKFSENRTCYNQINSAKYGSSLCLTFGIRRWLLLLMISRENHRNDQRLMSIEHDVILKMRAPFTNCNLWNGLFWFAFFGTCSLKGSVLYYIMNPIVNTQYIIIIKEMPIELNGNWRWHNFFPCTYNLLLAFATIFFQSQNYSKPTMST